MCSRCARTVMLKYMLQHEASGCTTHSTEQQYQQQRPAPREHNPRLNLKSGQKKPRQTPVSQSPCYPRSPEKSSRGFLPKVDNHDANHSTRQVPLQTRLSTKAAKKVTEPRTTTRRLGQPNGADKKFTTVSKKPVPPIISSHESVSRQTNSQQSERIPKHRLDPEAGGLQTIAGGCSFVLLYTNGL